MNDYAMHQAHFSGAQPGTGLLTSLIDNWRARRAVRRLEQLDDQLLRDIGVSRGDVAWAGHLPLSVNAALMLEERQRNSIRRLAR